MGYIRIINNYLPYLQMKDKHGYISKRYGNGHTGIDSVGNEWNNPVCAILDGQVEKVYKDSQLGNVVVCGNGYVTVKYYHLASVSVSAGTAVVAGTTTVGTEGATGTLATGKHLHVTMLVDGVMVDPEPYLDGTFNIPVKGGKEVILRKVVKPLNLRSTKSLKSDANLIYRNMPNDTILNVTETALVDGVKWGLVSVVINGKSYAGWCNIAEEWSREVK